MDKFDFCLRDGNDGDHFLATVKFDLVVLYGDQVCALGAPLDRFLTVYLDVCHVLVTSRHGAIVPLQVDLLAKLEQELLTLGVKNRVSQVHKGVTGGDLVNRFIYSHDLFKVINLRG